MLFRRHASGFLALLAALIAALPMVVARIPSAADYVNHLARHHIFANIGERADLARHYHVAWRWIGNLGVDLPTLALTPLIGTELATRLIATAIAPLLVVGIYLLSRTAHGKAAPSFALALPFVLAQPFLFGFLNYTFAIALGTIVAALWMRNNEKSPTKLALFACASVIVWTCHTMGWMFMLMIIAGSELVVRRGKILSSHAILTGLPLLLPLVPMLLWQGESSHRLASYGVDIVQQKLMNFVTMLKGGDKWLDLAMTGGLGLLALFALLKSAAGRLEPRLACGAAIALAATIFGPTTALGSWGADLRLAPYAAMLLILAIRPSSDQRINRAILCLSFALFALRATIIAYDWNRASRVYEHRLAILDSVPKGSRLGFLYVPQQCRGGWRLSIDSKLASYAVVRRDAFTNLMFHVPGSDLVQPRAASDRQSWTDGSQMVPLDCTSGRIDHRALNAMAADMAQAQFDYIWLAPNRPFDPAELPGYVLVRTQGTDRIFRREHDLPAGRSLPVSAIGKTTTDN